MAHQAEASNFSDELVSSFIDIGITDAFVVTGGAIAPFTNALAQQGKIRTHYMLTEQSAAVAAEAYGFFDGKPALLVITSGPGVTNALTGVAAAWANSAPVIVVSGQARSIDVVESKKSNCRQIGSQHLRTDLLVSSVVKLFIEPLEPLDPLQLVSNLYECATSNRMGPVWLSIPQDIQRSFSPRSALKKYEPAPRPLAEPKLLTQIVEALRNSQRPAFLLGNGSRNAMPALLRIAEKFEAAILTTWPGLDLLEEDVKLYVGRPGGIPSGWTPNLVNENADVILIVGARLDLGQIAYNPQIFAKNARVFRVDIDIEEFSRIPERASWKNIQADSDSFASALELAATECVAVSKAAWWQQIREWDKAHLRVGEVHQEILDGVSTYRVVEQLSRQYAGNLVATGSSGTCIEMVLQAWRTSPDQRVINSCGIGSMGFGIATAIGVAVKKPGNLILCIESDGSLAMNLQDLQTIWAWKLPIHLVILDSQGYKSINLSQGRQRQVFHGNDEETGLFLPNFISISEAIGFPIRNITHESELEDGIDWLRSNAGPSVLRIQVSATEEALPRLVSRINSQGKMETPPMAELFPEP
jgi:acetolactate synthase-1/2/3 large subunit